ncbi:hypothetical protein [Nitrosomonas communis]|uniref:hypothetical protein n=1 Tax=Nitrosomonas communis TaxID=44574 RepID=UPI0026E96ADB|nr:hypothetical protein [Nitrosomonas communis]MCO6427120.1 hypothetical protein [Nitrosomonas communis]
MEKIEYKSIPQERAECIFSLASDDFEKLSILLQSIARVSDDEYLVKGLADTALNVCLEAYGQLRELCLEAGLDTRNIEYHPALDENAVVQAFGGGK